MVILDERFVLRWHLFRSRGRFPQSALRPLKCCFQIVEVFLSNDLLVLQSPDNDAWRNTDLVSERYNFAA